MKQKVKGAIQIENIKRCYVDVVIKVPCPTCGTELESNLNENYLSYPIIPSVDKVYLYCDQCDADNVNCEYLLPIKLKSCDIVIEYDADDLREE